MRRWVTNMTGGKQVAGDQFEPTRATGCEVATARVSSVAKNLHLRFDHVSSVTGNTTRALL